MIKTVKGLPEQTIHDVAIKWYGDEAGIAKLIADNPGIHEFEKVTDMSIRVDTSYTLNKVVSNYFLNRDSVTY